MKQSFIDPTGTIVHHRRKIKPTHVERAYYGDGQSESLTTTVKTPFGKVSGLNCWEHSQLLLRYYTYWQDTSWSMTMQKPAFMQTIDRGNVRVQLLHDESMQNHPEDRFDQYMKLYPPMNTMPGVTVPIITIDRKPKKDVPVE